MNPTPCENKWCESVPTNFPTAGVEYNVAKCGSVETMIKDRKKFGGFTGRGVTPCPFGFYERNEKMAPWNGLDMNVLFFKTDQSSPYAVPQLDPRPLYRVGYVYRN